MEVLKMTFEDYNQIKDMLQIDYDEFWTAGILKNELENKASKYFVVKENNNILGFAGIWVSPVDCQITNIVVKKDSRNQGIGSILLEKLIEVAKETEFDVLGLEVSEKNIPAIKLYEKYGFKIVRN